MSLKRIEEVDVESIQQNGNDPESRELPDFSYVLVPFLYKGRIVGFKRGFPGKKVLFLKCIQAVFGKCKYLEIDNGLVGDEIKQAGIYCFETGMGFLSVKYEVERVDKGNGKNEIYKKIDEIAESVENGTWDVLRKASERAGRIVFFPTSPIRKIYTFNYLVGKVGDPASNILTENSGEVFMVENNRAYNYYCSPEHFTVIRNLPSNNLDEETKKQEEQFLEKYEQQFHLMVMLLLHEHQAYLRYRERIVIEDSSDYKAIELLKNDILNLRTCYSFRLSSEDRLFQELYSHYREVLELTEKEEALSDLIDKLDSELNKKKERNINIISIVLGVIGALQIISVVKDLFF